MKVKDIVNYMEHIAPTSLKESFDNVGLMVGDEDAEVNKILLALDCTNSVIDEAIEIGANMIITHHPLIFIKPSCIIKGNLQGGKIYKLIENKIALYSSHTNLDSVSGGLNQVITEMLGFKSSEIIDKKSGYENAGIGRVVTLDKAISCDDLIRIVKSTLQCETIKVARGKDQVKKLAIINGSGQDFFYTAMKMGVDAIITGDTTYHYVSDFKEMGINIIDAGHFNTEWLVFIKSITEKLSGLNGVELVKSNRSENPYEFL